METSVENQLAAANINYRIVAGGREALICCEDLAKIKPRLKVNEQCIGDKSPKTYINLDTGLFFCQRCRVSGALDREEVGTPTEAESQTKRGRFDPAFLHALSQALFLPLGQPALSYLKGRGFTEETIKAAGLGYHPHYDAVSIPNFDFSGGAVSVKYRYLDEVTAGMRYGQESLAGAPQLPYGIARLTEPRTGVLHITEGELDALSLKQIDPSADVVGLAGMQSFPASKRQDDNGILAYFQTYKTIFLYPDSEIHSRLTFTKHAQVLGNDRCFVIQLPTKDINEFLKNGGNKQALAEYRRQALKADGPPFSSFKVVAPAALAELKTTSTIAKRSTGLPTLDKYLAWMRPGELTILAGAGGGGKSTLAFNIAYSLLKQKTPVLLGSFEMAVKSAAIPRILSLHHRRNLLSEALNQGLTMDWDKYFRSTDPLAYLGILLPSSSSVSVTAVGSAIDAAFEDRGLAKKDIVVAVLDHFSRMARPSADLKGFDTAVFYETQISLIKDWTRRHPNLHVLLLAQFTKKGTADKFSKDFLRGSAALQQEADSILILNTEKDGSTTLTCEKVRNVAGHQGWGARLVLEYDPDTTEVREASSSDEY